MPLYFVLETFEWSASFFSKSSEKYPQSCKFPQIELFFSEFRAHCDIIWDAYLQASSFSLYWISTNLCSCCSKSKESNCCLKYWLDCSKVIYFCKSNPLFRWSESFAICKCRSNWSLSFVTWKTKMNKRFMTLIVGVIYEDEVSGVVGNISTRYVHCVG